jgi:Spy/CpxP family protein refolding chaperone
MRDNKLKFVLIVSLILNLSFLATAGYQYYKQSAYWTSLFGTKMKKGSFLFEELSLKPEQAKKMREKAMPFRAEIDKRRVEIAQKRKELINLMRADNPDAKAVDSVVSEISGMQEEMQRRVTTHMLEEKALLDKDQQKKFLDLIENAMTEGRQIGCPPAEHN